MNYLKSLGIAAVVVMAFTAFAAALLLGVGYLDSLVGDVATLLIFFTLMTSAVIHLMRS